MNTSRIVLVLMSSLIAATWCAKSDWIQSTLVTADVTGIWIGHIGATNPSINVRFELEQEGPKVKGYLRRAGSFGGSIPLIEGPVDGSVGGDVFRFTVTKAATQGEMTVSGDEMTGQVSVGGRLPIFLRRVSSSPIRSQCRWSLISSR